MRIEKMTIPNKIYKYSVLCKAVSIVHIVSGWVVYGDIVF